MISKKRYKEALSGVHHSEELTERIFEMTEKKKRPGIKKGLICAVAVLVALICGGLTANAATDGAVADYITKNLKIIVNGEVVEPKASSGKSYVDEDGSKYSHYEIEVDDNTVVEYDIVEDEDGVGWTSVGNIDPDVEISIQTDDFIEPTTSEN